ncbi:MAG: AMP-dependent synthetase [Pelagibacterales bacterium]|mgnify:FL=1|nr:AMP-dependent synthetase [Pelagibacterales bacterium]PPR15898.1 MAG: Phenylacetate-coenzyme A ligase [Alphaproteobacteria bacterium MarineAlpha9_Bin3]|tara:strand:+ start:2508 stop:3740 length:1233 start_codon:yes stop_codon:yes gene_type:complete
MNEKNVDLERRSVEERNNDQFKKLQIILEHAKNNSKGWKLILSDIIPTQISNRKDLQKLPITRKSELSDLQNKIPPLGGLNTKPVNQFKNMFVSPGPIYDPGGVEDFWRMSRAMRAAGFTEEDIVYNTFSYHLTPAGEMMEQGANYIGACVIPGGIGNTEQQLQAINNLKPSRYVGTPSFLKMILEKGIENNIDVSSLKTGLVGGEACPPSLKKILNELGCPVLQSYGTADLGLVAYETWENDGMFCDEEVIVEIIRPGSDEVLLDGEVGELVVTSLNPDYPLFRFATGDLSAVIQDKSSCGRTALRIKGWMGRADQTTKVRGMFVRPEQIAKIFKKLDKVSKLRLVVGNVDHKDTLKMLVEVSETESGLEKLIIEEIKAEIKLRAEVEIVSKNEIPNDGLVIEDTRTYE